jgi:hypothetical protein
VSDNGGVVTRSACECTTVTRLFLDVADNGTFRESGDREDVADGEGGFSAAVDELASVLALGGDEGFGAELIAVGVAEDDAGKGSTTARVMNYVLDDSANVAISLSEIERPQTGGIFVETGVGFELQRYEK